MWVAECHSLEFFASFLFQDKNEGLSGEDKLQARQYLGEITHWICKKNNVTLLAINSFRCL